MPITDENKDMLISAEDLVYYDATLKNINELSIKVVNAHFYEHLNKVDIELNVIRKVDFPSKAIEFYPYIEYGYTSILATTDMSIQDVKDNTYVFTFQLSESDLSEFKSDERGPVSIVLKDENGVVLGRSSAFISQNNTLNWKKVLNKPFDGIDDWNTYGIQVNHNNNIEYYGDIVTSEIILNGFEYGINSQDGTFGIGPNIEISCTLPSYLSHPFYFWDENPAYRAEFVISVNDGNTYNTYVAEASRSYVSSMSKCDSRFSLMFSYIGYGDTLIPLDVFYSAYFIEICFRIVEVETDVPFYVSSTLCVKNMIEYFGQPHLFDDAYASKLILLLDRTYHASYGCVSIYGAKYTSNGWLRKDEEKYIGTYYKTSAHGCLVIDRPDWYVGSYLWIDYCVDSDETSIIGTRTADPVVLREKQFSASSTYTVMRGSSYIYDISVTSSTCQISSITDFFSVINGISSIGPVPYNGNYIIYVSVDWDKIPSSIESFDITFTWVSD